MGLDFWHVASGPGRSQFRRRRRQPAPWTFIGKDGASTTRVSYEEDTLRPRRSPDHAFLRVGGHLAGETGRIGMIMKATPFFSKDVHAVDARNGLFKRLAPRRVDESL